MLTKYSRPKCQCIIVLFSKPTKYAKTLWKTNQITQNRFSPGLSSFSSVDDSQQRNASTEIFCRKNRFGIFRFNFLNNRLSWKMGKINNRKTGQ